MIKNIRLAKRRQQGSPHDQLLILAVRIGKYLMHGARVLGGHPIRHRGVMANLRKYAAG